MKLRKVAALVLAGAMGLSLMACGGGSTTPAETSAGAAQETKAEETKAEETQGQSEELVRGGVGDGQYKESPAVHALVEAGELPKIEDRLPAEPKVITVDEIGVYGGTYVGAAFGPSTGQVDTEQLRIQGLLRISQDLTEFTPNIIKGYDVNEETTEYTLHLREGMKWSNGDPFTTEDFMFWHDDILLNEEVNTAIAADYCSSDGTPMAYEAIDEYTLKITFTQPNPTFEIIMGKSAANLIRCFFAPKNYLSQYHIKYNDKAGEIAKEEGYESWALCFKDHCSNAQGQTDCECPDVFPWVLDRIDDQGNRFFARNPYYFAVDQEGNQLPYIDEQEALIVESGDVRNLKLISGEIHAAGENPLPVSTYTYLKENEAAGDYQVFLFDNTRGSDCAFTFNITSKDPVLNEIFNTVDFRKAMSVAIDRQTINETLYYGKGTVRQATASFDVSFMKDEFAQANVEYDVDKANELLDACGYEWNADHTVRLMPNGEEFNLVMETIEEFMPVSEMVAEYWEAVGIHVTLNQLERTYYLEKGISNDRQISAFTCDSVGEFNLRASSFSRMRPGNAFDDLEFMQGYKDYWDSDGANGVEPPQWISDLREDCFKFSSMTPDNPEYATLGESILQAYSDQCWMIGVSVSPRLVIISNRLGNTPTAGTFANDYNFWRPYGADFWYFKY